MKTIFKTSCFAALITVFVGCEPNTDDSMPVVDTQTITESELLNLVDLSVFTEPTGRSRPVVSYATVFDPITDAPAVNDVGKSALLRFKKGVGFALKSQQTPKHTFTVWLVIFNYPENCATPGSCEEVDFGNAEAVGIDVIYGSGGIVGGNGIGVSAGHVMEGTTYDSQREVFFGLPPLGLLDAEKAEIHLVTRSHGPKIPGMVDEQTSSYAGGCDDPYGTPPFTYIPVNSGECADIQFSVHRL